MEHLTTRPTLDLASHLFKFYNKDNNGKNRLNDNNNNNNNSNNNNNNINTILHPDLGPLCMYDPYTSTHTIIRVTVKKRDHLAPRFGTPMYI